MKAIYKHKILFLFVFFSFFLGSCLNDNVTNNTEDEDLVKISIFSDPHVYDPSLGTSGEAFQRYIESDRKMLVESEAILNSVIEMISSDESNIVIISGDLTKDGELKSHQLLISYLRKLKNKGKKIFVVPGNHDVENPEAYSYVNESTVRVPSVTAEEFKELYADFGYKDAISLDPNGSLSYISEPVEGVWLFCLDACRWRENTSKGHPVTGGVFSDETLAWIVTKLSEARQKNKLTIGVAHHNIVEHFNGQKFLFKDYVIDNWELVARTFAENGLKVVFTGHHHAHDARIYHSGNNFIVDVQTSSSVTWPCAIRSVKIDRNWIMKVNSEKITTINFNTQGKSFQDYAKSSLTEGLGNLIQYYLKQLGMPDQVVQLLSPIVFDVYLAYTHGNEEKLITDETKARLAQAKQILGSNPQLEILLTILEGMMQDLPPDDYEFTINLKTGTILNSIVSSEKKFLQNLK